MTKEDQIRKRVEQWRGHLPPEENIREVWEVACLYFPESYQANKRGSDLYYVKWSAHATLARAYGQIKLAPFEISNTFLLALVKGRKVRDEYIRKLLKAIGMKEQFDEVLSKKS
jgi:hypothetical protein